MYFVIYVLLNMYCLKFAEEKSQNAEKNLQVVPPLAHVLEYLGVYAQNFLGRFIGAKILFI